MTSKKAILLVNLGTPDAPTPEAVRRYLAEFLSDPHVIKAPSWLWQPLLNWVILPRRIVRVAALYEHIWTPEGSPMRVITEAQAVALQKKLGDGYEVFYGMRYGQPSLTKVMDRVAKRSYTALTILPLYPQYSDTTTGSVKERCIEVGKALGLALTYAPAYYDHPLYIAALVESIKRYWASHGRGEKLIFSFHGIPERYVAQGDVYPQHCEETVRRVVDALHLSEGEYATAYQSRFGPTAWLKPYTDVLLKHCAASGMKRVDVISPAFAADCLETLEEIAIGYQACFQAAGGQALHYIPALNLDDTHIDCMAALVNSGQ